MENYNCGITLPGKGIVEPKGIEMRYDDKHQSASFGAICDPMRKGMLTAQISYMFGELAVDIKTGDQLWIIEQLREIGYTGEFKQLDIGSLPDITDRCSAKVESLITHVNKDLDSISNLTPDLIKLNADKVTFGHLIYGRTEELRNPSYEIQDFSEGQVFQNIADIWRGMSQVLTRDEITPFPAAFRKFGRMALSVGKGKPQFAYFVQHKELRPAIEETLEIYHSAKEIKDLAMRMH